MCELSAPLVVSSLWHLTLTPYFLPRALPVRSEPRRSPYHPARLLVLTLSLLIVVSSCPARAEGTVQAITAIEKHHDRFSMQLYRPLRELSVQLASDGQYRSSIHPFQYMQNLVHRHYGVYSPRQMESVELMIHSYVSMGDYVDADRQHRFLYKIALHAYGPDDAEMIAAHLEFANWYRNTLRYNKALRLYLASQHALERCNDIDANLITLLGRGCGAHRIDGTDLHQRDLQKAGRKEPR